MSDVLGRWVSVRDGLEIHSKRHAAALVKAGDALAARVVELEAMLDAWRAAFGTQQLDHAVARLEQAEQRAAAFQKALGVAEREVRWMGEHPKYNDWAERTLAKIAAACPTCGGKGTVLGNELGDYEAPCPECGGD